MVTLERLQEEKCRTEINYFKENSNSQAHQNMQKKNSLEPKILELKIPKVKILEPEMSSEKISRARNSHKKISRAKTFWSQKFHEKISGAENSRKKFLESKIPTKKFPEP